MIYKTQLYFEINVGKESIPVKQTGRIAIMDKICPQEMRCFRNKRMPKIMILLFFNWRWPKKSQFSNNHGYSERTSTVYRIIVIF